MNRTCTHRRPSLTSVIAVLALFLALGSTAHAGGLLTGKQIKNESITGKDIRERSLRTVPRAERAIRAGSVGDLLTEQILTSSGCQEATVRGYATVLGAAGTIPNLYTGASLGSTFSCSEEAVQVRRAGTGHFLVKFPGNRGDLAFVQVRTEPVSEPVCTVVTKVATGAGIDSGAFRVKAFACSSTAPTDVTFSISVL